MSLIQSQQVFKLFVQVYESTGSQMLEYPHGWQVLGYDFSYPNITAAKKYIYIYPGPRLPVPGRAKAAGMVPSVKMFPNSSTVKLTFQKLGPNVQISVWTWRKMDYSAIFGFKTALFTVIILIKSAPSTATQSKIACVFGEGPGKLPSGMVVAEKYKKIKKSKIKKIQKNSKKFKKIIKKHGVQIFEYLLVSLGVYSGTSLHCCAQP